MSHTGVILVVDDENFNRVLLSTHLEEVGYGVRMASNGQQALDILESEPIDAVLLDLVMPGIDGYEVLTYMQTDEVMRYIPVIIISNLKDVDTLVQCIQLGATDHLPKPFKSVLLKARLDQALAQKRARDSERHYMRELEAQNQELDAFAGTVAHDLKTPLMGIVGFASMLVSHEGMFSTEERHDMMQTINSSGAQMTSIINELLMLSRIRKEDVMLMPVDMGSVIEAVKMRAKYLFQEYEPVLTWPDSWPQAIGYGPWLEEVWVNYITNGLKYGGQPPHLAFGADIQPGGEWIRFWITDNGQGVTAAQQETLFVPFTRFNQVRVEGQGLGLSIVQRIVEKLGGEVGVESEIGVGSTFWFALPLAET